MKKKSTIVTVFCLLLAILTIYCFAWLVTHIGADGHIYGDNPSGLGHSVDWQPHYYAPGTNYDGTCGAPDGVYEQKNWGFPDNVDFPSGGGWVKTGRGVQSPPH